MKMKRNPRGFKTGRFKDYYDADCIIQKSSLATKDAIWLGLEKCEPIIMATNAAKHGLKTDKDTGWITFPVPEDVQLSTRMHLTKKEVKKLIPILQHFVDTGDLP